MYFYAYLVTVPGVGLTGGAAPPPLQLDRGDRTADSPGHQTALPMR